MSTPNRRLALVVGFALVLAACQATEPKVPGLADAGCILDVRPRPSPKPPEPYQTKDPLDPVYMDFLYGIGEEEGDAEAGGEDEDEYFLSFDFEVGQEPLEIWPHRSNPAGGGDHYVLDRPARYELRVHYKPAQPMIGGGGTLDSIVLDVYRIDGRCPVLEKTVDGADALTNHACFGPAAVAAPLATPRVVALPYVGEKDDAGKTAVGVEFDAFGVDSGFTLVGRWLRRAPDWLADVVPWGGADERRIAPGVADAGCIIDPRPRPVPKPSLRAGEHGDSEAHYNTLEYYTTGPREVPSGDLYTVDFYVFLQYGGAFLAPFRDPEGKVLPLSAGMNQIHLTYRSLPILHDQVQVELFHGLQKFGVLRTGLASMRTAGQFAPPELVPLGIRKLKDGTKLDAVGVELDAFGVRTGFVLLGTDLTVRKRPPPPVQ